MADAWKNIRKTDALRKAFKQCGLRNDRHGLENHFLDVFGSETTFSAEEIQVMHKKEMETLEMDRTKRKWKREYDRIHGKRLKSKFVYVYGKLFQLQVMREITMRCPLGHICDILL